MISSEHYQFLPLWMQLTKSGPGRSCETSRRIELSPCDSQSDKESLSEVKAHMLGIPAILTWVQAFEELRIIYGHSLAIVIALP